MKKLLFSLVACIFACTSVMAQISTGKPNSTVIPRTGNRPQKGDWGIYIGGSVSQIMDLVEYCNTEGHEDGYWGLPLVNLKYYMTDRLELRMGFQFAARTTSKKTISGTEENTTTEKIFTGSDYTRFLPGIAYHFAPTNILDVYVGAQVPIGFNTDVARTSTKAPNYSSSSVARTGAFVLGAGAFVGLQFFIADLPIAIGVEGGYSGLLIAESTPYASYKSDNSKETYRTGTSTTTAQWGADAAITFSYYFH